MSVSLSLFPGTQVPIAVGPTQGPREVLAPANAPTGQGCPNSQSQHRPHQRHEEERTVCNRARQG